MKRILVAEDDAILANIYGENCRSEGFAVTIARDGKTAIEALKTHPPDLVLLDLMLPETNGVQVINFIRAHPGIENLPVLVLANAYFSNMVEAAWKAGANKCLARASCTPRRMIDEVRALLEATDNRLKAAPPAGERSSPEIRPLPNKADASQTGLAENFLRQAPGQMAQLRLAFQSVTAGGSANQVSNLHELFRAVHAFGGTAAMAHFHRTAQMCSALEALVKELHDKSKKLNPSSLRTMAQALDFLGILFEKEIPGSDVNASSLILVVDDEMISRETVCSALEKASLRALSVDDPMMALKLLEQNRFDLIFMDVEMPGMNGFELCKKLHVLDSNKNTPVVFVTSLHNFETRAQSALSGGADLIGKPFLLIELAVKALPYLFRAHLQARVTDGMSKAA